MSIKSVKKIGVFTALTMMIGSIVGVGIFFKSHGILRANDWNGTGTLISWILGGLLSLAAALSFAEIGTMSTHRTTGLMAWSEKTAGKKFGYFVRFNHPFYYFGLLASVLGFFASETFFNVLACYGAFKIGEIPAYVHGIVGMFIALGFITLNYISIRASGMFQKISTILKWIPLIAVALLGIVMATTNHMPQTGSWETNQPYFGHNSFTNGSSFKFTGMLAALPAVLFAFDSFLAAPTLVKKVEGGEKKMPFIVIVGMLSCLILYLLIGVSAALHGSGNVSSTPGTGGSVNGSGIFDQLFSKDAAITIGQIIMIFLCISTFGVTNGISSMAITAIEQAVETETIVGSRWINKKTKNGGLWFGLATMVFWFIVLTICAAVTKGDAIVDGLSNFTTVFMFLVYGFVIFKYTLKRDSFDSKKLNKKLFLAFAWAAIIGTTLIIGYQIFYGFLIDPILHPTHLVKGVAVDNDSHWGLFYSEGAMSVRKTIWVMLSMLVVFMVGPLVNYVWLRKVNKVQKDEIFMDTFVEKQ